MNEALRSKLLMFTGVGALLMFAAMQVVLRDLSPNVVVLQLCFTPEAFRQVLNAWQQSGIDAYRHHFPYDFAFLAFYGSFGYVLGSNSNVAPGISARLMGYLKWALPVAAGFDVCENMAHLVMLSSDASITPGFVAMSGVFSLLKWFLAVGFVAVIGVSRLARWRWRA